MTLDSSQKQTKRSQLQAADTPSNKKPAHIISPGKRKTVLRRVRRALLVFVILIVVLAGTGLLYQGIMSSFDNFRSSPPGQLFKVNGHSMHLLCQGTGSPTVVLEAALPGFSSDWGWVQPDVAQKTRVCAYDRAGYAWSEPASGSRDARQIASDLHTLLGRAGITGPYVLVGHSMGGLYIREFTALYPDEVAGLVFIDASHPDQWTLLPGFSLSAQQQSVAPVPIASRFGLLRIWANFNNIGADLPQAQQDEVRTFYSVSQTWDTDLAEINALPASDAEVRATGSLGDRPVVVLTAADEGLSPAAERVWMKLQDELAALSTNSVHQVIPGSNHGSLLFRKHDAAATSAAILQVVQAVRAHTSLH